MRSSGNYWSFRKRLKRGEQPVFRAPGGQKFATLQSPCQLDRSRSSRRSVCARSFAGSNAMPKRASLDWRDPPRKDKGCSRSF